MTIFVGLDLSLVSPGVAVNNTSDGTWSLYGFAQRCRERQFTYTNASTNIHLFPSIPRTGVTNELRYEHIRHYIVDCVLSELVPTIGERVVIGIECYAFGAKNSGSSYKLQELGGVLKHSIWKQFPTWSQVIIPPSQWKKKAIGTGRATKADALTFVLSNGPCVPLLSVLGLVVTKNGDIPCPAQDLADSACIVLALAVPTSENTCTIDSKATKKLPKRKRKRDEIPLKTLE
jgi:hypothetical protein